VSVVVPLLLLLLLAVTNPEHPLIANPHIASSAITPAVRPRRCRTAIQRLDIDFIIFFSPKFDGLCPSATEPVPRDNKPTWGTGTRVTGLWE